MPMTSFTAKPKKLTAKAFIVIFAVVVLAGVVVTAGLVAATGDDVRFTNWQAAFDHIAGRVTDVENKVSNLESKHSIVCATLLAEYDAGYDLFSSDTEQQSHTQGLREVEDYLDLATSGTHYQTYWTRAGAEAEYNRCEEEEEETSPATTPTPEPTTVTGTPAPTPQTTVTPQPVSQITTGYGDWYSRQSDCPSDWSSCTDDDEDEYVALLAHTHNSTFVLRRTNVYPSARYVRSSALQLLEQAKTELGRCSQRGDMISTMLPRRSPLPLTEEQRKPIRGAKTTLIPTRVCIFPSPTHKASIGRLRMRPRWLSQVPWIQEAQPPEQNSP